MGAWIHQLQDVQCALLVLCECVSGDRCPLTEVAMYIRVLSCLVAVAGLYWAACEATFAAPTIDQARALTSIPPSLLRYYCLKGGAEAYSVGMVTCLTK